MTNEEIEGKRWYNPSTTLGLGKSDFDSLKALLNAIKVKIGYITNFFIYLPTIYIGIKLILLYTIQIGSTLCGYITISYVDTFSTL